MINTRFNIPRFDFPGLPPVDPEIAQDTPQSNLAEEQLEQLREAQAEQQYWQQLNEYYQQGGTGSPPPSPPSGVPSSEGVTRKHFKAVGKPRTTPSSPKPKPAGVEALTASPKAKKSSILRKDTAQFRSILERKSS